MLRRRRRRGSRGLSLWNINGPGRFLNMHWPFEKITCLLPLKRQRKVKVFGQTLKLFPHLIVDQIDINPILVSSCERLLLTPHWQLPKIACRCHSPQKESSAIFWSIWPFPTFIYPLYNSLCVLLLLSFRDTCIGKLIGSVRMWVNFKVDREIRLLEVNLQNVGGRG